ncbi:transglutaminase-like domain-containing protein [Gemmiger sp.]
MNQTPVQELRPAGKTKYRNYVAWSISLSALLLAALTQAYAASWGSVALPGAAMLLWASVGTAVCIIGRRLSRRNTAARLLAVLPWPVLLVRTGVVSPARGVAFWVNGLITRWNLTHEGGTPLFHVEATQADVLTFSALVAMGMAQLVWWLVAERKVFWVGVLGFFWLGVMVFGSCYAPLPAALLLASVLCVAMSAAHVRITGHTVLVSLFVTAVLCLCALLPQGELSRVKDLREGLTNGVYTLRYGKMTLPEGDLYHASELTASDEEMLTVQTQQEKSFYLRGFIGAEYADGQWSPLPDAALGGDNAGMLKWLTAQGFDPLTQSADYWRLDDTTPEANKMSIEVTGAARYYLYAPVSLADTSAHEVNGETLRTKGLLGQKNYTYEEISDYRPAELMVASPWVTNPRTEEQRRYSEAEAVYRRFVYENYTTLDADTNALMQTIFWDGYDTDADGIYSDVSHVRDVLKRQVSYSVDAADVPENVDPVRYFLTGSRRGNAALYASATVQALRAKGIPARYVEGYCLPAARVGEGTVTLTGKDAHAWAEAYFDGIGRLPLDTVPGYYYEAVALQQMVGAPDAVHKTAALQNNDSEAARITGEDSNGSTDTPLELAKNVTVLVLGLLALAIMALAVAISAAEVLRALRYRFALRRYRKAPPELRVKQMEHYLYKMLHIYGIDTALGWNTKHMDRKLAKRFVDVEPGEYVRVCSLIEKTVYGGETPDLREERAMQGFLFKLAASGREEPLHRRLRLRYTCV